VDFVIYCGDRLFTIDNICTVDFEDDDEGVPATDIIFYQAKCNADEKIIRKKIARLRVLESKKKQDKKGAFIKFTKMKIKKYVSDRLAYFKHGERLVLNFHKWSGYVLIEELS
jgi:hypothetical protein